MLGENTMTDLWAYFSRVAVEFAAALFGMAYDPVVWFGFIAFLISGGLISLGRSSWWWWLGIGLLLVTFSTLERRYMGTGGKPPTSDYFALVLICLIGLAMGLGIGRWLAERMGVSSGR
jgi:hypothetical protein